MDLVDDEPPDRRKDLSRGAGEDEVQRLWSGDEDVGRVALHRAAHLVRGVAGADGGRDIRRHPAAALDLVADAHQRRAQVAVDVVGERLQRRHIKDATALRVGRHGFRRQAVDAPQEGSQGLAAPGGCGHQDVAARGHLAPASFLDLRRLHEGAAKPVSRGRRKEIENVPHVIQFDRFPAHKQVFVNRIEDDRRT